MQPEQTATSFGLSVVTQNVLYRSLTLTARMSVLLRRSRNAHPSRERQRAVEPFGLQRIIQTISQFAQAALNINRPVTPPASHADAPLYYRVNTTSSHRKKNSATPKSETDGEINLVLCIYDDTTFHSTQSSLGG